MPELDRKADQRGPDPARRAVWVHQGDIRAANARRVDADASPIGTARRSAGSHDAAELSDRSRPAAQVRRSGRSTGGCKDASGVTDRVGGV